MKTTRTVVDVLTRQPMAAVLWTGENQEEVRGFLKREAESEGWWRFEHGAVVLTPGFSGTGGTLVLPAGCWIVGEPSGGFTSYSRESFETAFRVLERAPSGVAWYRPRLSVSALQWTGDNQGEVAPFLGFDGQGAVWHFGEGSIVIRSYLRLNSPDTFKRVGRGMYELRRGGK